MTVSSFLDKKICRTSKFQNFINKSTHVLSLYAGTGRVLFYWTVVGFCQIFKVLLILSPAFWKKYQLFGCELYMLFCKALSQWPPRISKTLISFAVLLISFIGQFIWLSGARIWFQVPKTLSISLHTWTNIMKTLFSGQDRKDTLVTTFFVVIIGQNFIWQYYWTFGFAGPRLKRLWVSGYTTSR